MNKLKGKKNITSLFEAGEKLFAHPLCLFYKKKTSEKAYGVSVGKQSFSLAVDRNKIKRALRMGVRKHLFSVFENLEDNCYFIVLYLEKRKPVGDELDVAFKTLVEKIKKNIF